MNTEKLFNDIQLDLNAIYQKSKERLLKEEQIRSCLYFSLKNQGYLAAVERNYFKNENIECDLVFWKEESCESWLEIKTSHYSDLRNDKRRLDKNSKDTWINKPKEQINSWIKDLSKLGRLNSNNEKYFFLVEQHSGLGLFDIAVNESIEIKELKSKEINNYTFELPWLNAPVDFCTLRIFKI